MSYKIISKSSLDIKFRSHESEIKARMRLRGEVSNLTLQSVNVDRVEPTLTECFDCENSRDNTCSMHSEGKDSRLGIVNKMEVPLGHFSNQRMSVRG